MMVLALYGASSNMGSKVSHVTTPLKSARALRKRSNEYSESRQVRHRNISSALRGTIGTEYYSYYIHSQTSYRISKRLRCPSLTVTDYQLLFAPKESIDSFVPHLAHKETWGVPDTSVSAGLRQPLLCQATRTVIGLRISLSPNLSLITVAIPHPGNS